MKLPLLLINFKTYKEATGKNAVKLAKTCEAIAKKYGVSIAVAPSILDLSEVASRVDIPVFSQHIDPILKDGKHTGHVLAENVKAVGAVGTLLNHSERRLSLGEIEECIKIAKRFGLITVCCSESPERSEQIAKLGPDFIAYEDPVLIGSGIPISKAKADSVKEFVELLRKVNPKVIPLCGAGISTGEDVKAALKLRTKGVLVASAIVLAKDQKKAVEDMARALT
jgi:triosephosphate isomerase